MPTRVLFMFGRFVLGFVGFVGFVCALAMLALGGTAAQRSTGHPCNTRSANQCHLEPMCTWICLSGPGNAIACGCTDQTNVMGMLGAVTVVMGAGLLILSLAAMCASAKACFCKRSEQYGRMEDAL